MTASIHFYLNDREVQTSVPPGMLVLDYVRTVERHIGTKEGCREGDCGACAVLVGEPDGDGIRYRSITSCLMPAGELHGKHLVTIEGLNMDELSPVQEAVVDLGASQCGFCTPGIVVSLTGYLIEKKGRVTLEGVKSALGGHLCRCTGYRSLKDARTKLGEVTDTVDTIDGLVGRRVLPDYFQTIPERLRLIAERNGAPTDHGKRFVIGGGTDIYVQEGDEVAQSSASILNMYPELKTIERTGDTLTVGAMTSFEDFARSEIVQEIIPDIRNYMDEIASVQIRHRATLGGNIINASPIGDMTILILALNANLELKTESTTRNVPIQSFYLGYKTLDRRENEVLTQINIPIPPENARVNWEKASKRTYLDIASVNSAAVIMANGSTIESATITVGGVAPVPLLLDQTGSFLAGKTISADTVASAVEAAMVEVSPIDDVRGSADYKRLLTRQFIISHFAALYPEYVDAEVMV